MFLNDSIHALEKKEMACHESAEKSIAALNFNVSPEIQALYDRLSFIFPCRWDGESTIIGINPATTNPTISYTTWHAH